jgi:hypothetical protein
MDRYLGVIAKDKDWRAEHEAPIEAALKSASQQVRELKARLKAVDDSAPYSKFLCKVLKHLTAGTPVIMDAGRAEHFSEHASDALDLDAWDYPDLGFDFRQQEVELKFETSNSYDSDESCDVRFDDHVTLERLFPGAVNMIDFSDFEDHRANTAYDYTHEKVTIYWWGPLVAVPKTSRPEDPAA